MAAEQAEGLPPGGLVSAGEIDGADGAGAFLAFVREDAFLPELGAVEEFAAGGEAGEGIDSTALGEASADGVWGGVAGFVAADATAGFARTGVHPDELVAHHAPVAVEDLEVQEPIRRRLHVERAVGR